ncbi:MAG: prohibitin family protein [Patescibacteria group bacterium]|nr:prohibitin family protein [Patescibacteria group bacterium]
MNPKPPKAVIAGGIIVIVLVLLATTCLAVVPAGHRGVITLFGKVQDQIFDEGIHVKNPFKAVQNIEVRTRKLQVEADSASKDLQSVSTTIALNYHPSPEAVNKLFQEVGLDYGNRIIDPAIQESVKAAAAKFTAEELITKRSEVKAEIIDQLRGRLQTKHIVIDDFSIVNFDFSEQFNQAIESKQTAEQNALKAERDLERVKLEAQQKIEQAKAEAESLRLQRLEISQAMLQLRWIEKWDGKTPQYWGNATPFIGL